MNTAAKSADRAILDAYESIVRGLHPQEAAHWPVLAGYNVFYGSLGGWRVVFFKHSGNPGMVSTQNVGAIPVSSVGASEITDQNVEQVRERLLKHFRAKPDDAVFLVPPSNELLVSELDAMLRRHRMAMNLIPMKIFLSHKSPDKGLVRDFKSTLEALGFDPWLDEDAMAAGVQLERGILAGMKDSCAAVFFLTPNFADERYLAAEIEYAINEKRERGDGFAIISLVLEQDGVRPQVPALLRPYVWKEPRSDLEALREIIRALPIKVGDPRLR